MKISFRWSAIVLLIFNGTGALFGGWNLIADPTGASMGLSLTLLDHTFFPNYFFPGIILFVVNGLFSLVTAIWTYSEWKYYAPLIFLQGVIFSGWILSQMLLIRTVYFLHFILGGTGIVLIFIGIVLHRQNQKNRIKT